MQPGRTITNLAAVAGSSVESNFGDNLAQVSFVPDAIDVAIARTRVGSGAVPVGEEIAFTLVARNVGNLPAANVVVRDTFPAGLTRRRSTFPWRRCRSRLSSLRLRRRISRCG